MALTRDNERQIRAIFDASDCTEMSVGLGDQKLDMRKHAGAASAAREW